MTKFIDDILTTGGSSSSKDTASYMAPFLEAMYQEGSSVLKEPCYQSDIINVPTPSCTKGSPWVEERSLKNLVGDLADPQVTVVNNDNFHRASTVYPYHHPQLTTDCLDKTGVCTVNHISCTQNWYEALNEFDLGKTPIGATSMRVKLKSSTSVHVAAREADADFETLDHKLTECRDMNNEVFEWAYSMADKTAKNLYDTIGEKLVEVNDKEQPNGGLWIYEDLQWNESADQSEMDNKSVALILPEDELIPIFKSMHYCKMLSPFRALEWIYVDSQYAKGGYSAQQAEAPELKFLSE